MKLARSIVSIVVGACLLVCLLGAGYAAVAYIPQVSGIVTGFTGTDAVSPFDKTQLVEASVATRDYTVGSHDRDALMDQIRKMNKEVDSGYQNLSNEQLETAPEQYTLTRNALTHLDDCNEVFGIAKAVLIACLIIMLAGSFFVGVTGSSFEVGRAYFLAAIIAIFAIIAVAVWAFTSWDAFFASLHGLFFSDGTWTFSNDSLLICMYPQAFWTALGAIWAVVTVLCSVLFAFVGRWLKR